MKWKWRMGMGLAVAAATYCVLAYIFMWPPVVTQSFQDSPTSPCVKNLISIEAAIQEWAMDHHKQTGDAVTLDDIAAYIKYPSQGKIPTCPCGGVYIIPQVVGPSPACSLSTATNIPNIRIRVGHFHWMWRGWNQSIFHQSPYSHKNPDNKNGAE